MPQGIIHHVIVTSTCLRIYKLMELTFASWFLNSNAFVKTRHFAVAKALRAALRDRTGIDAVVVYDRPTKDFKPTAVEDAHQLFCRLVFFFQDF